MRLASATDQKTPNKPVIPLGRSGHAKWFGLTLLRYSDEFRDDLSRLYAPYFGDAAGEDFVEPIVRRYRDGVFAIAKTSVARTTEILGFTSFLPLTDFGVRLIEFGLFDGANIDPDALAADFRSATALYWWATVAEGVAFRALPLVELALSRAPFSGKDIYATAGTARGLNAMTRLGFSPLSGDGVVGGAVVRRREPNMETPRAH